MLGVKKRVDLPVFFLAATCRHAMLLVLKSETKNA
jgi:hypothetical protein